MPQLSQKCMRNTALVTRGGLSAASLGDARCSCSHRQKGAGRVSPSKRTCGPRRRDPVFVSGFLSHLPRPRRPQHRHVVVAVTVVQFDLMSSSPGDLERGLSRDLVCRPASFISILLSRSSSHESWLKGGRESKGQAKTSNVSCGWLAGETRSQTSQRHTRSICGQAAEFGARTEDKHQLIAPAPGVALFSLLCEKQSLPGRPWEAGAEACTEGRCLHEAVCFLVLGRICIFCLQSLTRGWHPLSLSFPIQRKRTRNGARQTPKIHQLGRSNV